MRKLSIAMLGTLFVILAACSSAPPEPADITIILDEYSFTPSDIELQVGQEVTITLVNEGTLDHEFMIGRDVTYNADLQPTGYEVDMFAAAGVTPNVSGGGMLMDHSDGHDDGDMESMDHGDDMSDDEMDDMDHSDDMSDEEMDMDEHDDGDEHDDDMGDMSDDEMAAMEVNMVMQPVGSDPTIVTFTVTEDMVGEWELGCFELDGVHYTSGMVGTLTITD